MRTFGHQRPVRGENKEIVKMIDSPVCAITCGELGGQFGRDRRRRVIFTLSTGDVVSMRPAGTTRTIRVEARDVYRWALECATRAFVRKVKEHTKTMTLKAARRKVRKELGL
jgi:hypothetical protein